MDQNDKAFRWLAKSNQAFFVLDEKNIGVLGQFSVEIRYPDEFYFPSVEESKQAMSLAVFAKETITKILEISGFKSSL
jgi:hypothetical protein